ncbi:MAG: hypothetical protein KIT16_14490 [Rhodospirillaceae bacterium]|nr:hypothetical protein [Rhodospirillaceae bacterium]
MRFFLAAACIATLAVPTVASAEADLTAARIVACTPEAVTRCKAGPRCTTRAATADERSDIMVIDFGAKSVSIRHGDSADPLGRIVGDATAGGVRRLVVQVVDSKERLSLALTAAGKLTLLIGRGGDKTEATCVAAS